MPRSLLHVSWHCRLLLCAICIHFGVAISQAQSPTDKQANVTDAERIRRILNEIKKPQKDRVDAEDPKKSAAAQAASQINETANRLASLRQLQTERERGLSGVVRGVERSALTPDDVITYPKDWKERTQARASSLAPITPKEKTILRSLESAMTVRLKNARFEDVIDFIRTKTGLNLVLDPAALKEADVTYDSTLSVDLRDVTVRTLLHKVLGEVGLTYVIRNEAIMVVTPGMAKQMLVTRTYYIRDLLPADWGFFSSVRAAQLIEMIQSTVEPQSWKANGGEGTIVYDPLTRALIVKQNAEFHSVLSSGAR
jgi:hypothetical protein